jgi:magnesium-transporting ATPase (P-type)
VDRIEQFAAKGFRTLTFAMKELESAEIDGVLTQEDIESCFTLLGASCVEDLLQLDVSRCLIDFKRAGI